MKKITCLTLAFAISISSFTLASAQTPNKALKNTKPALSSKIKKASSVKITSKLIKSKNKIVSVNVSIPVISGMSNKTIQNNLNKKFEKDILKFKNNTVKLAQEGQKDAIKNKYEFNTYDVTVDYKVNYNKNNLLSISTSYYNYTGGAHGSTDIVSKNINLKTGKELKLKDLFKANSNYKKVINAKIQKQINTNKDSFFQDSSSFKTISDNQAFYIKSGKIVIYFGLYEIAPYAAGIPSFEIPVSQVKSILNPQFLSL